MIYGLGAEILCAPLRMLLKLAPAGIQHTLHRAKIPIQNETSCNKFCWGGVSLKKTMYHAREQTQ